MSYRNKLESAGFRYVDRDLRAPYKDAVYITVDYDLPDDAGIGTEITIHATAAPVFVTLQKGDETRGVPSTVFKFHSVGTTVTFKRVENSFGQILWEAR